MAIPANPEASSNLASAARSVDGLDVLESLETPVLVLDGALVVHYANRAASALFDEVASSAVVVRDWHLCGPVRTWRDAVAGVLTGRASCRVEWETSGKQGHSASTWTGRLARVARHPVVEYPGVAEPAGAAGLVVLHVDPQGDAEARPEQRELTQRLASLGKVAAGVAHELNNPLDGVLRYVNLALRTIDDPDRSRVKSYLTNARTGLLRMVRIIGDLLEFSRVTDGAFDDHPIHAVIEQAIQDHAERAQQCSVVIAADFQSGCLPAVRGGRLLQVMGNLVKNALDAMPDGGRLTITSGIADEYVLITVADTGCGLPEPVEKLFEPFYTTKPEGEGTGLGLALCRDFVSAMGGTLTAGPAPGGGGLFTVRLPVSRCVDARRPGRRGAS